MLIMRNRKVFVTRHEKQFINMCLHWLTEPEMMYFIMETGSVSRALQFAAATMVYDLSLLNWK